MNTNTPGGIRHAHINTDQLIIEMHFFYMFTAISLTTIVVHNRYRPEIFQNSLIERMPPGFKFIYKTLHTFSK